VCVCVCVWVCVFGCVCVVCVVFFTQIFILLCSVVLVLWHAVPNLPQMDVWNVSKFHSLLT